jgi:Kef-type K+ transport system membrane component KefB
MVAAVSLLLLLVAARLTGALFVALRQPRVAGEIVAGILMRPILLALDVNLDPWPASFAVLYWAGLLLLMFFSGAETKALFRPGEQRTVAMLALSGTVLPFAVAALVFTFLDTMAFTGQADSRLALILVVGIATAVTSIPVISRIFHDLGIMASGFARLVLSVAVVEDIGLWAVLSIALAIAKTGFAADLLPALIVEILANLLLFVFALKLAPKLVSQRRVSPLPLAAGYLAFAYISGASMIFAAFLGGITIARGRTKNPRLTKVAETSFASVIPLYFALAGCRIDLGTAFDPRMMAGFLVFACGLKIAAVLAGARVSGFSAPAAWNLAIATNARGGPGIVVASVAFDAGIISAAFYTTLIATAILTSQAAGAWLQRILRLGRPLLEEARPTALPKEIAA